MKILVVDDTKEDLDLLDAVLSGKGYEVVSAMNGAEALEKLRAGKFDMVISDILMPVMDGFQLCRECKRDETLKDTPFAFYTATYTDAKDGEFALALGADRFIKKPMQPVEFLKVIQGMIQDVEKGEIGRKKPALVENDEIFKLYSERLVKKLEAKTLELERVVAERKGAEEKVENLARFPDENPNPVLRVAGDRTILYVNPAGSCQLSQWNCGVGEPAPGDLGQLVSAAHSSGGIQVADIDCGGRLFSFELVPVAGADYVNVYGRDITEQKNIEEQLRQSQKLEAIGRLAGGVAHDFNNMLGAIIGYSDIILATTDKADPLHRDIEHIKGAGERAAALTRQLLAFSRKQTLQPKVMDLNAAVTGIEKMLGRLIGEDIELSTVLADDLGRVKADPGQIDQIIMNLAVNSRDAMPDGGKLTVETANAELDENYAENHVGVTPGPHVMLAVTDTGCGMDAETRSHIFEPFFTTKGIDKGTGLGLSTVYGIVKQTGGNVWVYSEPGKGTAFKIYLPRIEETVEAAERRRPAAARARGAETVLVVEDEEVLRRLASRILSLAGYKVLEARIGGEALVLCEQHDGPIHLMLTDVVMPQMSGRKLAERVASLRPDMKVAYMSGYTDDAVVRNGVLDPDMPFIQKPFTASGLARKVREVLDSPGNAPQQA